MSDYVANCQKCGRPIRRCASGEWRHLDHGTFSCGYPEPPTLLKVTCPSCTRLKAENERLRGTAKGLLLVPESDYQAMRDVCEAAAEVKRLSLPIRGKAGDYYLTITESKKFTNDDGSFHYKKHKIFLYKEDFNEFSDTLGEMIDYIFNNKGEEVISERHQKDYQKNHIPEPSENGAPSASSFTDIDFDDI